MIKAVEALAAGLGEAETTGADRRFRDLLEILPAAVYTTDAYGTVTFYNRAAMELAGRTPEIGTDRWCVTFRLYRPDGTPLPHDKCPMAIALKERRPVRDVEILAERPDGEMVPVMPFPTPILDRHGALNGAVNLLVDLSKLKRAEQAAARAEGQRDLLVAELSHRVKNTLATVISIARQSFAMGPSLEEAVKSFDGRLRVLAQTHGTLAESNWDGASLRRMLVDELAPYRSADGKNIEINGPDISLNPRCAVVLGMAFHELATNAAKHGALSSKNGCLAIQWSVEDAPRRLHLDWIERGGPPVRRPDRSGFGRLLLERALKADLQGHVELKFAQDGLRCSILGRIEDVPARHA